MTRFKDNCRASIATSLRDYAMNSAERESYKDFVVERSLVQDGWSGLPPTNSELQNAFRDFVFDLLLAQQSKKERPDLSHVDHRLAVYAAINFLEACNFPSGLILPLRELVGVLTDAADAERRKGKPGSPRMPHNEAVDAIIAAASVTLLSRRKNRSISDSLLLVSKSSGLDMKWLRQFRQNLLRGKGGVRVDQYQVIVSAMGTATDEQILSSLKRRA